MAAAIVAVIALVGSTPLSSGAASQQARQIVVFDAVGRETSFVDMPPAGPSPGDTENITAKLRDAGGHFVGTAHTKCVFTKVITNDVLEACLSSGKTSEGTLTLAGVGHLESMNPPWPVQRGTGKYKGVQGNLVFEKDIPVDPDVPLASGRLFSVVLLDLAGKPLRVGRVPRPATNAAFIRRANAVCSATEANVARLAPFPFSNFNAFRPDKILLPQVGRFFDQPARHRFPVELLAQLERLGQPPASSAAWRNVLAARRAVLKNMDRQINTALAGNASGFVRAVYQQASVYNQLVFRSAVFGVQSCTFT